MPKASAKGGADFAPIPAGLHTGICYSVIDLGTQPSNNPAFQDSRKVLLIWELPNERADFQNKTTGAMENKARVISAEYTLSLGSKANLRKVLESWRGKPFTKEEAEGFEVGVLAGKACQLNVMHKPSKDGTKTYANVMAIVPMPKGSPAMKPENPVVVFDLPEKGPVVFPPTMPEWIQNKIKMSHEYNDIISGKASRQTDAPQAFPTDGKPDDDLPF